MIRLRKIVAFSASLLACTVQGASCCAGEVPNGRDLRAALGPTALKELNPVQRGLSPVEL